ncbi:MAG: methyltransferase domain-containing protein [Gemmataceae bacterium]|nr:methyltransferase domain-containing protein [Gemmata sp.]MDW8197635.1 methyltransferase domain-containing protein [Gemmataceae bacterium]
MPPRFHRTPPELVTETVHETVFVGDYTFRIQRPATADQLLDHPWCRSAYVADEYVPYWPTLWPSARMLAKAVLREPWERYPQPVEVLEIGCGLGLAGIAGLARGLHVTFSDVDETALAFAAANAQLNGFRTGYRTQLLDFRCPPRNRRFPVVIGSDLMYEERLVDPLVALLAAVLAPGGVCWIADPDRLPARVFRWKLEEAGYSVTTELVRAGEPGGERTKGTLYRIRPAPKG